MLKTAATIFGIILLIVGILGFIPQANVGSYLFGIFHVNLIHNLVHVASGIIAILCALASEYASRIYFQVFGIIYGIVALLGFYYMNQNILGILANNMADNILHVIIAVVALYLGFAYKNLPMSNSHDRRLE